MTRIVTAAGRSRHFRETRRNYGLRVPLWDVPAHLMCGWRMAEDFAEAFWDDGRLLLTPPACWREVV